MKKSNTKAGLNIQFFTFLVFGVGVGGVHVVWTTLLFEFLPLKHSFVLFRKKNLKYNISFKNMSKLVHLGMGGNDYCYE